MDTEEEYFGPGDPRRMSFHDLLTRDLVYHVTQRQGRQGTALCVPEVSVPGARFDAVSIDACSGKALAFEVKVRMPDLQSWVRAERWKVAFEHGAKSVLVYPEAFGFIEGLPRGVYAFPKLKSGGWPPLHTGPVEATPSVRLMLGVIGALRREAFYSGHIEALGETIVEAMRRLDESRASAAE